MRRRASIFGTMTAAVLLALHPAPVSRMVNSARNFERCFRDLRSSKESLSPIERVLFSFVLANTHSNPAEATAVHHGPRG